MARFHTIFGPADEETGISEKQLVPFTPEEEAEADAAELAAANAPQPVPEVISDRQFAQGLAHRGVITEAEALAWVSDGTLPAAMAAYAAALPSEMSFDALMILKGATEFRRSHPLVSAFAAALNIDGAAIDDLWRYCASL